MTVSGILNKKGRAVLTVAHDTPISEAIGIMHAEKIGALVISSDNRTIQGIVSERDVLGALATHGAALMDLAVEDIMTRRVESCTPDDSLKQIMSVMTLRRFRHMPVTDDNGLCGMISIRDVVKQRLEVAEMETNVAREVLILSR